MIGKTVSHYKITRKLGAGGMGEVYLAEDTELGRNVALKFLPPGYSRDPGVLARFKREAQAAAALNHPNIITIYEVAMYEDRPYIAMEHVEGSSLDDHVKERSLSLNSVVDLAIQIGEGLAKAHGAGIVHRDLKPDNILIDEDGRPKILDFGLAKLAGVTRITREDSTVGTLYYMSPEQTRGEDVDHRSDIFSLGTLLYEMITNNLPFQGEHPSAVMYAISNADPQPLARYNNEATDNLQRIVSKMLAKDVTERYQSTADLLADLKHERRLSDSASDPEKVPEKKQKKKASPVARAFKIGLPIVAAVIVLAIVFGIIDIEIMPERTATASENSLAVMYFENMTDRADPKLHGEIIANLLITALSDEDHLRVVSSQRLYDILKALDKEGTRVIDRNTASEVARRAGARSMLLGSILQTEPMVVTYQLVDVASGDVTDSHRVDGREDETVFTLVDRMTVNLRENLALPEATAGGEERSVAEITTSSADAYRLYLQALELYYKIYKEEAVDLYKAALAIDSTMALAAMRLTGPNMPLPDEERADYARQAYRHRDRVGERDRHMINAIYESHFGTSDGVLRELQVVIDKFPDDKEALFHLADAHWRILRDLPGAIRYMRKVVELDPNFKLAYNSIAYIYMEMGEYEKALEPLDRYILIAPDEPNPYDSRAEVLGLLGRLDEAIVWYEKALEIDPGFSWVVTNLTRMHIFKREYETALSYVRKELRSENPHVRSAARLQRAAIPATQGRLREAVADFDRGIAEDDKAGYTGFVHNFLYLAQAHVLAALDRREAAIAAFDRVLELGLAQSGAIGVTEYDKVELLAWVGDLPAAEAWLEAHPLEQPTVEKRAAYAFARGAIDFHHGEYGKACEHFEDAVKWNRFFIYDYYRGQAYLKSARLDDAVALYRRLVHAYGVGRLDYPLQSTWVHYHAGIAYQQAGLVADAIAEYEEFLALCEEADPEFHGVDDARERLERLRQGL